ncbi:MAG: penicillin acylase family protein [Ignavibacteria bacterium]|nr:penicillin acylase family protein [Ignavibacteria bacterium]
MHQIIKNILGIVILIIAVVITLGILFNDLSKKSFYKESGNIKVEGISKNVNIYKDKFGVPHIEAENENDLYYSLGYIHAQDRLWQMDMARRVAEGRLSEILGNDALVYDKLFRTIGIYKTAYQLFENVSPKSRELLQNYSNGVNYFIETHSKILPLEFDVLDYKPDYWKPEHSLMIVRLMGWELNLSWYTEYMFGEIVNKYGLSKAQDFFPSYPEDAPYIIKTQTETNEKNLHKTSDTTKQPPRTVIENNYKDLTILGSDFFNDLINFRKFIGIPGTHIGSNAWVISGKKSETGKPILANDPHLALQVPSKWYEVELINKNINMSVSGFSIPGAPGIVIGHNNIISWGITNLMNDDSDFYILDKSAGSSNKYIYNNIHYNLDSTVESIKIKNEVDEYVFTTYQTIIGPVISDIEKTGFISEQRFTNIENKILTFRWTGFDVSDETESIYNVNYSKNWDDFKNALKNFGLPASNFVYADTAGNIGYHVAGKIPLRKSLTEFSSPVYPSGGEVDWTGYINFDNLPNTYNPEDGFIVTANNKPKKDFEQYISNLYEPHYRAERIESLLKARNNFSANEFKLIQNDVYGLQAKDFCKYIYIAYSDTTKKYGDDTLFVKILKNWDYEMKSYSIPAMLFSQFEVELYKNLYKGKLGEELFKDYMFLKNIPVRNTSRLLIENNSWFFENVNALGQTENRDFIVRKSFKEAVEILKLILGSDYNNNWAWGNLHKVILQHPLGIVPALSSLLNIGPYKIGGNGTTIALAEYSFSQALKTGEFETFLGPSMRMIVDLSNMNNYYSILPPGQSGQPLHPNYRDQTRLWLNGEYKNVTSFSNAAGNENVKVLILEPH